MFVTRRQVRTREKVRELLAEGLTQNQIAERLGLVRSTVACHARGIGREPDARFTRRYDWAEVQRYYDAGHSARQCREHFGFAIETWNSAVRRGAIVPRRERCRSGSCWPAGATASI